MKSRCTGSLDGSDKALLALGLFVHVDALEDFLGGLRCLGFVGTELLKWVRSNRVVSNQIAGRHLPNNVEFSFIIDNELLLSMGFGVIFQETGELGGCVLWRLLATCLEL